MKRPDRQPTVSVIVPAYNSGSFLRETIKSVLNQTYKNFEILIVDDGSTDNTAEVVSSCAGRIKYIKQPHSGLPAVGRNVGIKNSSGKYLAFLDADDAWEPDKLNRQVMILEKQPDAGLVCGNAYHWTDHKQVDNLRLYLGPEQGHSGHVLRYLLKDNFVITSTVMVRRDLFDNIGLFSEAPELRSIEDYDLWLHMATMTNVCYIKDPLAVYRDHANSIRSEQSPITYWQSMLYILDRLDQHLSELGCRDPEIELLIRDLTFTYGWYLSKARWLATERLKAIGSVLKMIWQNPMTGLKLVYEKLGGKGAVTERRGRVRQ